MDNNNVCAVCGENEGLPEFNTSEPNEHTYCLVCVQDRFQVAVDSEGLFPVTMDPTLDTVLEIDDYADRFPAELVARFREAERVYRVAPHNRIRCPYPHFNADGTVTPSGATCNHYLGERRPFNGDGNHEPENCSLCGRAVCMRCGRNTSSIDLEFVSPACFRSQELVDLDASRNSVDRGSAFQLCPWCDRHIFHGGACYEMRCPCARSFCFVCGEALGRNNRHYQHPSAHGRWPQQADGTLDLDEPQPGTDPFNIDAADFEDPRPFDRHPSASLEAAERAITVDRRLRVNRSTQNPGRNDQQRRWVEQIVLSARHLLAMMHNRFFNDGGMNESPRSVLRRVRFAHHASLFRLNVNRIQRTNEDGIQLPEGIDYSHLSRFIRAGLRSQANVRSGSQQQQQNEWEALRIFVTDQLQIYEHSEQEENAEQLTEAVRGDRQAAMHTRELLIPIRSMLEIIDGHATRGTFPPAEAFVIRTELANLQAALTATGRHFGHVANFRIMGHDQLAAYDIADLFLNRLFEEGGEGPLGPLLTGTRHEDTEIWTRDMQDVLRVERERLQRWNTFGQVVIPVLDPPARFQDLENGVNELAATLERLAHPSGLAADRLEIKRRVLLQLQGFANAQGQVLPVQGPLRPLFYHLIDCLVPLGPFQRPHRNDSSPSQPSSSGGDSPGPSGPSEHQSPPPEISNGPPPEIPNAFGRTPEEWMDHWLWVNEQYVHALENRFRNRVAMADGVLHDVLPALRHIMLRLAQPDTYLRVENQSFVDALRVHLYEWQNGRGNIVGEEDFILRGFGDLDRAGRQRLQDYLRVVVREADTNDEIAPQRADRVPQLGQIVHRLIARSRATEEEDTLTYINLFREMFEELQPLFLDAGGNLPAGYDDLEDFLESLQRYYMWSRRAQRLIHLPPEERTMRSYRYAARTVGRYDVHNTPIGSFEAFFPELYRIYEMLHALDPP